jgi:polyisoprenoid-binding protein YceI
MMFVPSAAARIVRAAGSRCLLQVGLLAGLLALSACRTPPPPPPPPAPAAPPAPVVVPERIDHYRVDDQASEVLILVYRDGRMARLGHNHVLRVRQLSGEVVVPKDRVNTTFTLEFPVAALSIDEKALRAEQGEDFKATIDPASIDGTRDHMLGDKLLDAAHFPVIRLESGPLSAEGDQWTASLSIRVRDHVSTVLVPVSLDLNSDSLTASGELDLTHSQLGLTPYSVGLGAIRVAESMHVRFRVLARHVEDSDGADHP